MKIRSSTSLIAGCVFALSGCAPVYQVSHMPAFMNVDQQEVFGEFLDAVESGRMKAKVIFRDSSDVETEFRYVSRKGDECIHVSYSPFQGAPDTLQCHNVYQRESVPNGKWVHLNENGSYILGGDRYGCEHRPFSDSLLMQSCSLLGGVVSLPQQFSSSYTPIK